MTATNLHLHLLLLSFSLLLSTTTTTTTITTTNQEQRQETPITRFQTYLRFNTSHPNPNYYPPISFLTSIATTLNLTTRTMELAPNKPALLLTWPGISRFPLPSIVLNSHLDSIPSGDPSKWLHPPYSATLTPSGQIIARGAQDDKCIAMQYLEAIRNLKARNFQPVRDVHVSYVPDEEIGGFDGWAKLVKTDLFRDLNVGFFLDEGQASVGKEYRVFYADRSPWHVVITARGAPGHGSRMFDGSAMENLMKSVEVISRFRESQFEFVKAGVKSNSEVVSVNPVFLKAGIPSPTGFVMNMQPSEAQAGFDIRLPPTEDPVLIRKRIAEEWAPAIRNMTFEIVEKGPMRDLNGRPLMTTADNSNPWWRVFKQAIESAGAKLAKPEILSSTTDTRFLRQLGIPAFGFSPMANTPILLHDHNECLKDKEFLKGIEVYEHIISSLSSFTEVDSI